LERLAVGRDRQVLLVVAGGEDGQGGVRRDCARLEHEVAVGIAESERCAVGDPAALDGLAVDVSQGACDLARRGRGRREGPGGAADGDLLRSRRGRGGVWWRGRGGSWWRFAGG